MNVTSIKNKRGLLNKLIIYENIGRMSENK